MSGTTEVPETLISPGKPAEPAVAGVEPADDVRPMVSAAVTTVLRPSAEDQISSAHLQSAYDFGLAYQAPATSSTASIIDGYVCDHKPEDFDQQYAARASEKTVHNSIFKCSVSGDFIDDGVFTDTNVLLEILQNSEPNDSKGTWFALEFYAEGQWRSVVEEIGNFSENQIEAVRIPDNGRGYLPTDMTTIGGGKRSDSRSAGRFGTGMKISDRSALGKGVKIVRYSRNWRAVPYLEPILTSAGHNHTVSYSVDFFADCLGGSVVEYRNLTAPMLTALRQIQDLYLPLDASLKERLLAQTQSGLVLSPKTHQGSIVMVKGRIYTLRVATERSLLFSYDLHDCVIDDQNRHYVGSSDATENIRSIWSQVNDPRLFCRLFAEAKDGISCHEHSMKGLEDVPDAFRQAATTFYQIKNFDTTFIDDEETTDEDRKLLTRQGYQGIKVPTKVRFIVETFERTGILPGRQLMKSICEERYVSSGAENENEDFASCVCRAVATVERLGKGNKNMLVFFKEADSEEESSLNYYDFLQALKAGRKLTPTRFFVGIDHNYIAEMPLGDKRNYKWLWRRDFDDVIASAIAAGVDCSVRTDIFELVPIKRAGGSLLYTFTWEKLPERPLGITIDINNDYQAAQLRKLHEYSLNLDPDYQPVERTEHGDIVSLEGTRIYEQGIKKNEGRLFGEAINARRILSYNTPARLSENIIDEAIAMIVKNATNPQVPIAILKRAKEEDRETYFIEYLSDNHLPATPAIWKQAFEEVFGNDVVVDDMEAHPMKDLALMVKDSSEIKRVRLNPKLAGVLRACGVKTLSEAVTAAKVVEYKPTPVKAALLEVAKLADEAIRQALPEGVALMPTRIRGVTSVQNAYGQEIKSGSGYMDPMLSDLTIYVSEKIIHPKRVEQLFSFILRKKLDAYRKVMNPSDHAEFRAQAIAIADTCMMQAHFYRKVSRMMYDRERKIPELVSRTLERMQAGTVIREEEFDLVPTSAGGYRRLPTLRKMQQSLAARLKPTKKERLPKIESASSQAMSVPARIVFGLTATVAALALAVMVVRQTPSGLRKRIANAIEEIMPDASSRDTSGEPSKLADLMRRFAELIATDPDGYERPSLARRTRIGVSIDRNHISGDDFDNPAEYVGYQLGTFVSAPALEWGDFMSEQAQTIYDGKGWQHDDDISDFENPNYPEVRRIAHYQVIGKQKEVLLRTRAGGYIDPASIKVLKRDSSNSANFTVEKQSNGEYLVRITDDKARAIMYSTLSPINWQDLAENLTDADFINLPQDVYAYYTAKPDIDPMRVRFASTLYPEFSTLDQFLNFLRTKRPFERLKIIRAVVSKMRYTSTERTERAYAKFHSGKLLQKDFLDFVLSSPELEQPGDGDCDAQNSAFALLARMAGIPAKLDYVFTNNGVAHAPASVFLPRVGWVLMDTMGERILTERFTFGANDLPFGRRVELPPDVVERALIERLRRQQEFKERGCYELQP